ncbi:MAG: hypothetical protein WB643_13915 [Candidatus Bathyarchaeia archaeon]
MRSEAEIGWQRNTYYLVVASILLLALSQFHGVPFVQLIIMSMGVVQSLAWLVVTHRSSEYLDHFKKETRKLETQLGHSHVYSLEVKGIETRQTHYLVPSAFLVLWFLMLVALLAGKLAF